MLLKQQMYNIIASLVIAVYEVYCSYIRQYNTLAVIIE
jgi:hypothetical protein